MRELALGRFSRAGAHAGYGSQAERDVRVALDAGPAVEAVASQPMWLHGVSKTRTSRPDVRHHGAARVLGPTGPYREETR